MAVWILVEGDFIHGVFSTKEKAFDCKIKYCWHARIVSYIVE